MAAAALSLADLHEDEVRFEEELQANPYAVKSWTAYIKIQQSAQARNLLYERALKQVPGSYKLWNAYLLERRKQVRNLCPTSEAFVDVNNVFERALVFMNKMPRIWLDYCAFLVQQRKITIARRTFDRALQSLPLTLHDRVWEPYIQFARTCGVFQTTVRVYRRFLVSDPSQRETYVDFLLESEQYDEAANQLVKLLEDQATGRAHGLWITLVDILAKHGSEIKSVRAEPVIRAGIKNFTDETGRLWCALADYFVRLGNFERARDIYEEALVAVLTVRDFSIVFDAYAQFEETMLSAQMELAAEDAEDEPDAMRELDPDAPDVDLRLQRLSALMDRRPLLLNSVLLRQNPHNVAEWLKRTKIIAGKGHTDEAKAPGAEEDDKHDPNETMNPKVLVTFTEACKTIDPAKAVGKLSSLWIGFAKYFEKFGDLKSARDVFTRSFQVKYRVLDDLAAVWCERAEMELRHGHYQTALELLQQAVKPPSARHLREKHTSATAEQDSEVQARLYRSHRVWALYLDLEESLGTVETTCAAYDQAMDLRILTPLHVLNYANFLEEHQHFEQSFKVFERSLDLFTFPHAKDIWVAYLNKFVQRYGKAKLERARDLFEQVLETVPPEDSVIFYVLYAQLEETHGLIRHAMSVYDRGTKAVAPKDKFNLFVRYIAKVEEYYGATKTREIYQRAIELLPEDQVKDMCLRYANMEKQLGEIDRARGIMRHAAQFCDPRTVVTFWKAWYDFEEEHGNEDTFREMMHIKRTIATQFSTVNYIAAEMSAELPDKPPAAPSSGRDAAMRALESEAVADMEDEDMHVPAAAAAPAAASANPDEIDVDMDAPAPAASRDAAEMDIEELQVPDSVFGAAREALLKQQQEKSQDTDDKLGALERFKASKRARLSAGLNQ